jgi:hypothetical protein
VATRLLITSEADYPGWRASLNGGEIPIIHTNVAFRGLQIPADRHRVEFVFRPGFYGGRPHLLSLGREIKHLCLHVGEHRDSAVGVRIPIREMSAAQRIGYDG